MAKAVVHGAQPLMSSQLSVFSNQSLVPTLRVGTQARTLCVLCRGAMPQAQSRGMRNKLEPIRMAWLKP